MVSGWRAAVLGALSIGGTFSTPAPASAADAEWGCQVLLCAASTNPSWHGVPYCVPPMVKLITAMAEPHFSWPICSGAGTGAPGYEKYADCPAGYTIGYTWSGGDNSSRSEPNLCVKTDNRCGSGSSSGHNGDSCAETVSLPRPVRGQPYYFDIRQSSGGTQRFWFDLNH
ncbi:hypothetical protein RHSP_41328 (plasmid) [Rhizobium freirei PRF 81]|uniref:Secreted protein n=1 Tax=Rhizobium freirei PRF 81 TaxID=363754 RepID=N6UY74_9HYPH|nr:hypothetical protein [Rhizobium freirei]ENN83827.1 hypothetical protein RHSP_41328 [Rhizobium freirei PRF 81]